MNVNILKKQQRESSSEGHSHLDDLNREHDLVNVLVNDDYGYLVEDYIKE